MTFSERKGDRMDGPALLSKDRQTIIWGDEGCAAAVEAVRAMIDRTGQVGVIVHSRLHDAEAGALGNPGVRLLLVCRTPVSVVQAALEEGATPSDALKLWAAGATEVLRVVRGRRRQVTIIDAEGALRDPAALARALNLGATEPREPAIVPKAESDPVLTVIAAQALRQDPVANALAGELAAGTANLSSNQLVDAIEETYLRYRVSKEETFLLRRQLTMLQEQLESDYLNFSKLEASFKVQAAELEAKQDELARQRNELDKQKSELKTRREELKRASETLEISAKDLRSARRALDRLKSSKSYKMTAPLRWLRARMQLKKKTSNA